MKSGFAAASVSFAAGLLKRTKDDTTIAAAAVTAAFLGLTASVDDQPEKETDDVEEC